MICSCGAELIWGGDFSYEDLGMEGDGIVSNHSCPSDDCGVESVEVYTNNDITKRKHYDTKFN